MDNTRHDRAIIMIATYIIGFVSAYIAFGVEQLEQYIDLPTPVAQTIAVAETKQVDVTNKASSLVIDDRGLVLVTADEETLLAARKNSSLSASVVTATAGGSSKLIEAELSRDSLFAYFCEQQNEDDETCKAYVYSVKKDVMYPLQIAGEVFTPTVADHFSVWSAGGYLMVNGYSSVSPETPWLLQ